MPTIPDLPCAGCGKMLWRGPGSLPAGEATCNSCRRADWEHGTRKGYREAKCRCDECRRWAADSIRSYRSSYQASTGQSLSRKYRNRGDNNAYVSRAERLAIYERDGWTCQLCGEEVPQDVDPNDKLAPTLDHIECRSWVLIPDHSPENLRLAHRSCNASRRNAA